MENQIRRHIGQILLDGEFLSKSDLSRAFEEQKHTKELLGEVLIRMGLLNYRDIRAPLLVQEHLSTLDDAVTITAGKRQKLGALLVQSGLITRVQLNQVLAEQKTSGERLGEVFARLGVLTERQLAALLEFQHNQGVGSNFGPLKLGELIAASGYLSQGQLDAALQKQGVSHKKIGDILVEEGYIRPSRIKQYRHMQKMLVKSVLAAILCLGMSASVSSASSISLQWEANNEADLAGYKVYYSAGSTPLEGTIPVIINNETTATINGLDPSSSYKFAVTAYNKDGFEGFYSDIVTVTEQVAPIVEIVSPVEAGSVIGVVSISVNASDNVGVTKVEYFVNGELKYTNTSAPFGYLWDTSSLIPGPYTLMVKASDAAGNVTQLSRSVTVLHDAIPPTVALTSLANNAAIHGTVLVSSSASDNVGVTLVEFYRDSILQYSSNVAPYSYSWDTRRVNDGPYVIYAKATDSSGNTSQSSLVTVIVDNTAPVLNGSFVMPATSASLTVPVTGIIATDNRGVTGYLITESAIAPSVDSFGWSASAPVSFTFSTYGTKTAYAWAKDGSGNISTPLSAIVSITVPTNTNYTIADALLALRIAVGVVDPTAEQRVRTDVGPLVGGKSSPDGKTDIGDALIILSDVVGTRKLPM